MKFTNSSLVVFTRLSPNNSGQRTHEIDRITPHCVVGQCTAEGLGEWFAKSSTQASSNYGIDKDGRVGMYVEEKNRSWCSSSNDNDQRAVTIEAASDNKAPYKFAPGVYEKTIDLCVDICKRNGKKRVVYISDQITALKYKPADDEMLLTFHRWFSKTKSCPGDWFMARAASFAKAINDRLNPTPEPEQYYKIQAGDSLTKIAKKFNTSVEMLLALNPKITNKNLIKKGDLIRVK